MQSGILNVYKEKGWTSFDVVAKLRGLTGIRKIGHTGTLDPEAEGVLVVCFGRATRLVELMGADTKTYEASARLGIVTDTQDMTGTVLSSADVLVTGEELEGALLSFLGGQLQIPPMYSARKIQGRKLYELAREGRTVERKASPVVFSDLELLSAGLPDFQFRVTCSKGAYIRTLCHDVGAKLGCGAAMTGLLRTRCGSFRIENSVRIADLIDDPSKLTAGPWFTPIEDYFKELKIVHSDRMLDNAIRNGNRFSARDVSKDNLTDMEEVRVYLSTGEFAGIYRFEKETQSFRPVRYLYESDS